MVQNCGHYPILKGKQLKAGPHKFEDVS